jgi:hypothetical protein
MLAGHCHLCPHLRRLDTSVNLVVPLVIIIAQEPIVSVGVAVVVDMADTLGSTEWRRGPRSDMSKMSTCANVIG